MKRDICRYTVAYRQKRQLQWKQVPPRIADCKRRLVLCRTLPKGRKKCA